MTNFTKLPTAVFRNRPHYWILGIVLLQGAIFLKVAVRSDGSPFDYTTVWRASGHWLSRQPVYDDVLSAYPPSSAMLHAPLSLLPLKIAGDVQVGLCVLSLSLALWLALRFYDRTTTPQFFSLLALLMLNTPAVSTAIGLGNDGCILALLVVYFFILIEKNKFSRAALLLGVMLALKPLPIALLLIFIITRRWRAFLLALLVPLALNLIALAWFRHPGEVATLVRRLAAGTTFPTELVMFNSSFVQLGRAHGFPAGVVILSRLLISLLALWAAWLAWNRDVPMLLRSVDSASLAMVGSFLASPVLESHHFLLLLLFVASSTQAASLVRNPLVAIGLFMVASNNFVPGASLGDRLAIQNNVGGVLVVVGSLTSLISGRWSQSLGGASTPSMAAKRRGRMETSSPTNEPTDAVVT